MEISDQQLLEIIKNTPLVSIDLVVRDKEERILLGLRKNEPAKDTWFVLGGRIRKDETLDKAFERITENELGVKYSRDQARFIGVFENLYETNYLGIDGVGTHFVVLTYEIKLPEIPEILPASQHKEYRWFSKEDKDKAGKNGAIHPYVLPYFEIDILTDAQYEILNARRDSFNNLVWETPVLSLTAQAFLFTIALNPDVSVTARYLSAILALITAIASIQVLAKHRFMEREHARMLESYETNQRLIRINKRSTFYPVKLFERISSVKIWYAILSVFALCALIIIINNLLNLALF